MTIKEDHHAVDRNPRRLLAQEPDAHSGPAGHLVHRHVRDGVVRHTPFRDQVLRLAAQLLHGGAGLTDHLRDHHRRVRLADAQVGHRPWRGRRRRRMSTVSQKTFNQQLKKYYSFYTGGFILFVVALAIGEKMGMSNKWIGYCFLFFTILLYAGIGIMSRTLEVAEYYVA